MQRNPRLPALRLSPGKQNLPVSGLKERTAFQVMPVANENLIGGQLGNNCKIKKSCSQKTASEAGPLKEEERKRKGWEVCGLVLLGVL